MEPSWSPRHASLNAWSCITKCMHGSGAFGKCAVAGLPSCDIPHRMHGHKLVHAPVCTRRHKLSRIHGELHEEVLAPRTILPLLLASFSIPLPALTTIDVVCLELLQEPFHTSPAYNLK